MNKLKNDGIVYLEADKDGIVTLTFVQAVEIVKRKKPFYVEGQFFRASVCESSNFDTCYNCNLDSLCKKPVSDICNDLEFLMNVPIILKLLNEQPYEIDK